MKSSVIISALGALLLGSSAIALADDWRGGHDRGPNHQPRNERNWSDHDRRDWGWSHFDRRHQGHPRWHGDYRPYYPYHHHGHGYYGRIAPHGYHREGVTIILRGHIR